MKKRMIPIILCLAICLSSLASCSSTKNCSRSFFYMDTVISVVLYDTSNEFAESVFLRCKELLVDAESRWARFDGESEVAKWNASQTGADIRLDHRTVALLEKAMDISQATGGAFDVTVAPLIDLWKTCEEEARLPAADEMDAVLSHVGYGEIAILEGSAVKHDPQMQIDLGGIGKGAAISELIDFLQTQAIRGGLVTFGSNVAVFGSKKDNSPFRIAVRDPKDPNGTVATVLLEGGDVLSVSGDYERYVTIDGVQYHHILDPSTGYPAQSGLSSAVVVMKDGALADALSTALFVMGYEKSMELYGTDRFGFEALFIESTEKIHTTPGLSWE